MSIPPIKVTLPKVARGRPQPTQVEIPEEDLLEYQAIIAADLGVIGGPMLNHIVSPK